MDVEQHVLRDATQPPWSDEAEQRTLARVLEARRSPSQSEKNHRRPTTFALAAAAVAVLSIAGISAAKFVRRASPVASTPATHGANVSHDGARLALPDGSEALLGDGGEVQLELASVDRVSLRQRRGTVTYRVRRDPRRAFEVIVGSVRVSVRGTVFDVIHSGAAVEVRVREGRVLVEDPRSSVELGVGETVRLALANEPVAPVEAQSDAALARSSDEDASSAIEPSTRPVRRAVEPARNTRTIASTAPEPEPSAPASSSVPALLARVDEARAGGDHDLAAQLLRQLLARDLSPPLRASTSFTLSRVERARGAHRAAAEALADCVARDPRGPLAEDAMAEQALSWERAGQRARAVSVAEAYRARWPQGVHLARLRHLQ